MFTLRKYKDASDVLRMLHANDWRSVNHGQIVSLVNHLSKIDKDVAIECVRQLPNFMASSTDIISELGNRLDNILKVNKDLTLESIKTHNKILDTLQWRIEHENLDESTKNTIIEDMVNEAYAIDKIIKDAKESNNALFKQVAGIGAAAIAFGVTILGDGDTVRNLMNIPTKITKK